METENIAVMTIFGLLFVAFVVFFIVMETEVETPYRQCVETCNDRSPMTNELTIIRKQCFEGCNLIEPRECSGLEG